MDLIKKHITQPISAAPLAVFRIVFGVMMLASVIRFALKGWIQQIYIEPTYHFTYFGFEWVKPLGEFGMYTLFFLMAVGAVGIALGWFYRFSATLFFLSFTYVELIDKTTYLNHYYFVSLVSFLMILVPANGYFSIDSWRRPSILQRKVPAWTINIIKFQLGVVYFYAGLAKLNYEWLFNAMPLKIWLPANSHLPLIGSLLNYEQTAYVFSWFGAFYDLTIVFFLLFAATRWYAYLAVIFFHGMTAALFQIGMFPYIMILATLIFFSPDFHQKIVERISSILHLSLSKVTPVSEGIKKPATAQPIVLFLAAYMLFQMAFPFRYLLYPGNLFWTEEGYRFSWRVMLMEKAGYTVFNVSDPTSGKQEQVMNYEYLTENQEKMMSTQPDMILQFAHYLEDEYRKKGFSDPEIRVDSYVTLNGKRSRRFIDPNIDLTKVDKGFHHKTWILSDSETLTAQK